MDWLEGALHRAAQQLSGLLNPVLFALERLGGLIRQQLDEFGVPYDWQRPMITVAWVLVLFMVVRTLAGWLRLIAIVVAAVILAKVYGFLPG